MPVEELAHNLEALISDVAGEYKISSSTLFNLATSESQLDPTKESKQGDRGLFQINRKYHPEVSDDCAFDPECATRWTAEQIQKGKLSSWTAANCYSYASLFVKLPRMAEIAPNSPPVVGSVAIFTYGSTKHLAVVTAIQEGGFTVKEANYRPAVVGTRFIKWATPSLTGFYSPMAPP